MDEEEKIYICTLTLTIRAENKKEALNKFYERMDYLEFTSDSVQVEEEKDGEYA